MIKWHTHLDTCTPTPQNVCMYAHIKCIHTQYLIFKTYINFSGADLLIRPLSFSLSFSNLQVLHHATVLHTFINTQSILIHQVLQHNL